MNKYDSIKKEREERINSIEFKNKELKFRSRILNEQYLKCVDDEIDL